MQNDATVQEKKNGGVSDKEAMTAAQAGFQQIMKVSTFLREKDPTNFLAYRYNRLSVWSDLDRLPESKNRTTDIEPPEGPMVKGFTDMKNSGKWETIINIAEKLLPRFKFWLDLNLLTSESLNMLGIRYQKAAEVVHQETAFLVSRLPGIENLKYSDGTPFASETTKSWLKKHDFVCKSPQQSGNEELTADIEKARQLSKEHRMIDAVEFLQRRLAEIHSKQNRLTLRMELADILIGFRQYKLVVSHLEQICKTITDHQLEIWEPALARQGLEIIWKGYRGTEEDKYADKAEDALQRISRIDPVAAYNLIKVKEG